MSFKAVFWDSSRLIEEKAVVISGSFCWANEDTEKISIKDSIHHILSALKCYYIITGSDSLRVKKVFSPNNTKLFSLQFTWSEFCTALACDCLLLFQSIFTEFYLSCSAEIHLATFLLDFNWIKTVTFTKNETVAGQFVTSKHVFCCICSLSWRMMDMGKMLRHSQAPCLAAGRVSAMQSASAGHQSLECVCRFSIQSNFTH